MTQRAQRQCTCETPRPRQQADFRYYCETCSFHVAVSASPQDKTDQNDQGSCSDSHPRRDADRNDEQVKESPRTSFTPGPWQVIEDRYEPTDGPAKPYVGTVAQRRIATVWHHGQLKGPYPVVNGFVTIGKVCGQTPYHGVTIREADARLIAAAPDLFAACEAFVTAWERSLQLEKTDTALALAKAAIQKARGSV